MSKNRVTIEQIKISCRCMQKLLQVGMSENFAIRHLEFLANNFAKYYIIGKVSPDHADEYRLWSKAALHEKNQSQNQNLQYGQYLRVEHGTPRREFARQIFKAFLSEGLNEDWLKQLCLDLWSVAVITHEEDRRLNALAKQKFQTPEQRWSAAGIEF